MTKKRLTNKSAQRSQRKQTAPEGAPVDSDATSPAREASGHRWTFLSNHAHVLICLAKEPDMRLRDVAASIGITERSVQNLVSDLEAEGLLVRHREGRRNSYELHLDHPLRHPIEKHRNVEDLVALILG